MKFLISVIDDLSNSGTPAEMSTIDAFNDELRANGQFIFAWGLEDSKTATVIDNRNDANIETGRKLAFAASKACNRKVELRKLHGN